MAATEPESAQKPLCIVSACLCGIPCRYDGKDVKVNLADFSVPGGVPRPLPDFAALRASGLVLAVCPEVEGGLPVPRSPVEIRDGRAVSATGKDFTREFHSGALKALEKARQTSLPDGSLLAVLKDKSPSCGSTCVYDGTFSGRVIPGEGVTAALLRRHRVTVLNESEGAARLAELLKL